MSITNNNPIVVDDFTLMKEGGSVFFSQNIFKKKYFGKNILFPGSYSTNVISEDSNNVGNYTGDDLKLVNGVSIVKEGTLYYYYMIDDGANIWAINSLYTGQKVYDTNDTSRYGDIKSLGNGENDPIIYSYGGGFTSKLGLIRRGEATGGSSTTLVDSSKAMNFTDMSIAAGDYVYNLKDNKLFTIDVGGIAADTLTITAVDGGDFANGDEYCIVDPNYDDMGYHNISTPSGRRIIEFDGDYYLLDGDYLSMVSYDPSTSVVTFSVNHKPLDSGWVCRCGDSNGDTIAIGANKLGRGKIYLWDKSSDGWNKKIHLDREIEAIKAYGNNYIFVSGASLYITNGYSIQELAKMPMMDEKKSIYMKPTGIDIYNDKVIINCSGNDLCGTGIYIYNLTDGDFTYSPYDYSSSASENKANYGTTAGVVFVDNSSNTSYSKIYYGYSGDSSGEIDNTYNINRLLLGAYNSNGNFITSPINIGIDTVIKKIEVNLISAPEKVAELTSDVNFSIECKIYNCDSQLFKYAQVKTTQTDANEIVINGEIFTGAEVGDEILIREGANGFSRREITSISGSGTDTETLTLDEDLNYLSNNDVNFYIMPFKKYGMKKRTITDYVKTVDFTPNFSGDNIMIEINIVGSSSYPTPGIESIKIYT